MAGYVSSLTGAVGPSPGKTPGMLIASTSVQGRITRITMSCPDTPADNMILWRVQRFTASGTATAKTPLAKNPFTAAAALTTEENATVEPTYTANAELWGPHGVHQRMIKELSFAPGREICTNVTADNGIGVAAQHATASPAAEVTIEWEE